MFYESYFSTHLSEMLTWIGIYTGHNPNTFVGLVGKVRKKLSPEGGRKGGWRKKHAQRDRRARGSNPGPAAC